MALCLVCGTASNALFPAVVPDDQINQILQTADIASYCFHGNQGLLAKAVADKGAIFSVLLRRCKPGTIHGAVETEL
jgi:hypothetical protein